MIASFRSKDLKRFWKKDERAGINPNWHEQVEDILILLESAKNPEALRQPGLNLHKLKGDLKGHYGVTVTGNWRITFRFEDENVCDVDLTDYH